MEPRTLRGQKLCQTVALPDGVGAQFSKNMLAALGAIRDWADEQGRCTVSDLNIAELAGVGMSTTREAIKRAQSLGLIAIASTRPRGQRVIINKGIARLSEDRHSPCKGFERESP